MSEFNDYLPSLVSVLSHESEDFRAGKVSKFLPEWISLTIDQDIISNVSGVKIELMIECDCIVIEIDALLSKVVLQPVSPVAGKVISPSFYV